MTTKTFPSPIPGTTLPNGATVLRVKRVGSPHDDHPTWLVLAKWFQGQRIEYVTWKYTTEVASYSGHYSRHYGEAVNDFYRRTGR